MSGVEELVLGCVGTCERGGFGVCAADCYPGHHGQPETHFPAHAGGAGALLQHGAGGLEHSGADAAFAVHLHAPVGDGGRQFLLSAEQRVLADGAVSVHTAGHVVLHVHHKRTHGFHTHDVEALAHQVVTRHERGLATFGNRGRATARGHRDGDEEQDGR